VELWWQWRQVLCLDSTLLQSSTFSSTRSSTPMPAAMVGCLPVAVLGDTFNADTVKCVWCKYRQHPLNSFVTTRSTYASVAGKWQISSCHWVSVRGLLCVVTEWCDGSMHQYARWCNSHFKRWVELGRTQLFHVEITARCALSLLLWNTPCVTPFQLHLVFTVTREFSAYCK